MAHRLNKIKTEKYNMPDGTGGDGEGGGDDGGEKPGTGIGS